MKPTHNGSNHGVPITSVLGAVAMRSLRLECDGRLICSPVFEAFPILHRLLAPSLALLNYLYFIVDWHSQWRRRQLVPVPRLSPATPLPLALTTAQAMCLQLAGKLTATSTLTSGSNTSGTTGASFTPVALAAPQ